MMFLVRISKKKDAGGRFFFFLLFIISYRLLALHIIAFPQGYVGALRSNINKKREAALKNEAGGDEKHPFFYLALMHLFIVLNRLLFLITHLNAQWNGTTGHY